MSMDAATKKKIIDEYATSDGDTGSPEVQVAILTKRIAPRPTSSATGRSSSALGCVADHHN